tara:strand:+ start:17771 stop:18742 length:972 start_codon:yes stop_codon:yes gene_type:complete
MVNKILMTLLIVLVLLFGGFGVIYFIYQNIPGKPVNLEPVVVEAPIAQNQTYEEVMQFYPSMKFNHNKISYKVEEECKGDKRERMIEAFDELSSLVGVISFYEVEFKEGVDIEISCSGQEGVVEGEYFIAGEGGAKEIILTERYNIINQGVVLLHGNPHGFLECSWANVELHELIHVFGFDHSENPDSLMYSLLESCSQRLDESIINELKTLYSQENLADLYLEDVEIVKKRRYIDFDLTVKNSGSIDAENVKLSVFDDGELVKSFDLGDEEGKIKYGAGIKISIENLRLKSSSPDEIQLVIDSDNFIKEIDEENNIAKISFE